MPENGEGQPPGPPEYKVYRSRRGFLSRLGAPDLSKLRERGRRGRRPGEERPPKRRIRPRRSVRRRRWLWVVLFAIVGWLLLSFLAFAVSAQLQSGKLSGDASKSLGGNPFLLFSPQTILVIGTDARPPGTREAGAKIRPKCYAEQAVGDTPTPDCVGDARSDTLLLIRAGGGDFRKLSIPRDSLAEIPGHGAQKINAAYALGGADLTVKTVEQFMNISIDHIAIVNFTGFQNLIDAIGGVDVKVPVRICTKINGGAGNGQGGVTLKLSKGEHTLSGAEALAYARTREDPCDPAYTDLNREAAQQAVIGGIKDRITDPLRLPYNFIKGPIIGWDAPQAFVSDMGFFTMPQLVLAAAIGGNSSPALLRPSPIPGPGGSLVIPQSVRQDAAKKLING